MSKRAHKRSDIAAAAALVGGEPPEPPDDDYRCPTCGYRKRPEKTVHPRLGEKIACMGCGGHACSVCDRPLPLPGKTPLKPVKIDGKVVGAAALVYRREGDKIVCGECLK